MCVFVKELSEVLCHFSYITALCAGCLHLQVWCNQQACADIWQTTDHKQTNISALLQHHLPALLINRAAVSLHHDVGL